MVRLLFEALLFPAAAAGIIASVEHVTHHTMKASLARDDKADAPARTGKIKGSVRNIAPGSTNVGC